MIIHPLRPIDDNEVSEVLKSPAGSDILGNLLIYFRLTMVNNSAADPLVLKELARYSGAWSHEKKQLTFSDREKYVAFLLKWG